MYGRLAGYEGVDRVSYDPDVTREWEERHPIEHIISRGIQLAIEAMWFIVLGFLIFSFTIGPFIQAYVDTFGGK